MQRIFIISALLLLAAVPLRADETPAAVPAADEPAPAEAADSTALALSGAAPDRVWDAANTAYINGDFRGAVRAYEALLARGLSSMKLHYNLGNAYFKSGEVGLAILHYRRALRLAPGNDDIRYNLELVEALTKDEIEAVPEFFLAGWLRAVRHTMSCTAWTLLSLGLLAATLGLLVVYLLSQRLSWRKAGFYGTLAAGLLFLAASAFAAAERREVLDRTEAVVTAASAAVKSSPDKSATDLFVLHEGTVVRITDRLDSWAEITIADGKKGWIEEGKIAII